MITSGLVSRLVRGVICCLDGLGVREDNADVLLDLLVLRETTALAKRSCSRSFFLLDEVRRDISEEMISEHRSGQLYSSPVSNLDAAGKAPESFCFPRSVLSLDLATLPSSSANIVSSLDSTPATACCRREPHREEAFGAG